MSDPEKLREEANKLANSGGGFFSKLFGGNKVRFSSEKFQFFPKKTQIC